VPELQAVKTEFIAQMADLRHGLTSLSRFHVSPPIAERLASRIDTAEASIKRVLAKRITLVKMQDDVATLRIKLADLREQSDWILQDFSAETTRKINSLIKNARNGELAVNQSIDSLFSGFFRASLGHNNLTRGIEAVMDLAPSRSTPQIAVRSDLPRRKLEEKFNNVTWDLAQLPASAGRQELARIIVAMREIVLGPEGLFSYQKTLRELQMNLEAGRSTRITLVTEISQLAAELVARAQAQVAVSSDLLSSATQRLIWVLAAALMIALGVVMLANTLIVEPQINQ